MPYSNVNESLQWFQNKLEEKNSELKSLRNQETSYKNAVSNNEKWLAQYKNDRKDCKNYALSSKAKKCLDKTDAWIRDEKIKLDANKNKLKGVQDQIKDVLNEISSLEEKIDSIQEQTSAIAHEQEELANQGISLTELKVIALGEADANRIKATGEADASRSVGDAEAGAITKTTEETLDELEEREQIKNQRAKAFMWIGIGVGILLLIFGIVFIKKQMKKDK